VSGISPAAFEQISDDLELKAAAAAACVLGARLIRRDVPPAQKMRDFDLVLSDGSLEPLEVTRCADEEALQTWARIGAGVLAAPSLRRRWLLSVPSSVPVSNGQRAAYDVRAFKKRIIGALEALEARGCERVDWGRLQREPALRKAFEVLLELRVADGFARPLPARASGHVSLMAAVGGITLPDLIAIGVEREAIEPDNLAKLAAPPQARRRHLFVVFDGSSGSYFNAADRALASRLPRLPAPITTAWVAARSFVLATTPPGPWRHHALPRSVFDEPEKWLG
jgi:hypothetical protein